MAKPRIFVSSTFYDLRQIREDMERMIRDLGYEPVLHERGAIPYGKDERPEDYAYREIDLCDILVSIIGGRFGSESQSEPGYSISQNELKRALDKGTQVFIFIERNVLSEYETYKRNKDNEEITYHFSDDKRVYEFIDQLYELPSNNPIASFGTAADIMVYLKEQWAGLFQRFLQEQMRAHEHSTLQEMNSVAKTLRELVNFLTEERKSKDEAIQNILLANHPAFRQLAALTGAPYRVFFSNREEFEKWLKARGWNMVDNTEAKLDENSIEEWTNKNKHFKDGHLVIMNDLFDGDGHLKIFSDSEWDDNWISWVVDVPF